MSSAIKPNVRKSMAKIWRNFINNIQPETSKKEKEAADEWFRRKQGREAEME